MTNNSNEVCVMYYGLNEMNTLEIERDIDLIPLVHGITVTQALNIAKTFTCKYKEVKLYDGEYEAFITVTNRINKPRLYTYYPEDYNAVGIKYGLIVEVSKDEEEDQTDLQKEKWDNYWNDYSQCGIRVDY